MDFFAGCLPFLLRRKARQCVISLLCVRELRTKLFIGTPSHTFGKGQDLSICTCFSGPRRKVGDFVSYVSSLVVGGYVWCSFLVLQQISIKEGKARVSYSSYYVVRAALEKIRYHAPLPFPGRTERQLLQLESPSRTSFVAHLPEGEAK